MGLSQYGILQNLAQQKSRENPLKTGFSRLFLTFGGANLLQFAFETALSMPFGNHVVTQHDRCAMREDGIGNK